jgi:hypothetical protein
MPGRQQKRSTPSLKLRISYQKAGLFLFKLETATSGNASHVGAIYSVAMWSLMMVLPCEAILKSTPFTWTLTDVLC